MIEALGILFGGVSRLGQHYLEGKDKDKERLHEAVMFDKQIKLQEQKAVSDTDMRKMEISASSNMGELNALTDVIKAQGEEAKSAGGWVANLSASVRPVLSYWVYLLYTISKLMSLFIGVSLGLPLQSIASLLYTEFDGALLGSITSFWFMDRSLRKIGK